MDALKQFFAYLRRAPVVVQIIAVLALCTAALFHFDLVPTGKDKKTSSTEPAKAGAGQTAINTVASGNTSSTNVNVYTGVSPQASIAKTGDYVDGKQIASPSGAQAVAVTIDAMTQKIAAAWHTAHSEDDDPKWQYIKHTATHTVKYRYFEKSDGCLEIVRVEAGHLPLDKWVANPLPIGRLHEDEAMNTPNLLVEPDLGQQVSESISRKSLMDSIRSALPHEVIAFAKPQLGVPSGPMYCLNPHPGTYTWYWGQQNGCLLPQFRVFSDGCSHYQVFNSCAGVWDPQINWTFCRAH